MQFHLQTDEEQEIVTGSFSGYDLHNLEPTFKFLIQTLNYFCRPQRNPLLWRKFKKGQTRVDAICKTFDR